MKDKLQDLIGQQLDSEFVTVVHADKESCGVLLEDFSRLSKTGREDFAALLDATVETVRPSNDGPELEVVISGVDPQELERFRDDHDAFMEAEQAMGPIM